MQFEQQRQHIPSAVECIIQENGVSEEEACRELYKQVEDAWKDLNAAFFYPESPPMPLLLRILNYARVMELLYRAEDGYSYSINTKRRSQAYLLPQSPHCGHNIVCLAILKLPRPTTPHAFLFAIPAIRCFDGYWLPSSLLLSHGSGLPHLPPSMWTVNITAPITMVLA
ncbi:hypothetical protein Cgig2_006885 [Carnegiea gigantea]|uniref:Terpene synthase metal-binding domain-containing protein n=1 Tax=Carnegiea gigantea TaxID=171969 RepID=A0A9Q1QBK4_9CARY|nr:hypothetical protein Cgig2_006885 [Carnegiea gigantea]